LTEERTVEVPYRIGEVRVIERIERLDAQLEGAPVGQAEFAARRQVQLRHAEA